MNPPAAYMYMRQGMNGSSKGFCLKHPHTFDQTIPEKDIVPLYFTDSVMVGDYLLTPIPRTPDKIYISHVSGEGGEFATDSLALVIRTFFESRF